jgi:hypothetical protein
VRWCDRCDGWVLQVRHQASSGVRASCEGSWFRDGEEAREFGVRAAGEAFCDVAGHRPRRPPQLIGQVAIAGNPSRLHSLGYARSKLAGKLITSQILKPVRTSHAQYRCIARAVWILEETGPGANSALRFLLFRRREETQILRRTSRRTRRTHQPHLEHPHAPVAPRTQCTQRT